MDEMQLKLRLFPDRVQQSSMKCAVLSVMFQSMKKTTSIIPVSAAIRTRLCVRPMGCRTTFARYAVARWITMRHPSPSACMKNQGCAIYWVFKNPETKINEDAMNPLMYALKKSGAAKSCRQSQSPISSRKSTHCRLFPQTAAPVRA